MILALSNLLRCVLWSIMCVSLVNVACDFQKNVCLLSLDEVLYKVNRSNLIDCAAHIIYILTDREVLRSSTITVFFLHFVILSVLTCILTHSDQMHIHLTSLFSLETSLFYHYVISPFITHKLFCSEVCLSGINVATPAFF